MATLSVDSYFFSIQLLLGKTINFNLYFVNFKSSAIQVTYIHTYIHQFIEAPSLGIFSHKVKIVNNKLYYKSIL